MAEYVPLVMPTMTGTADFTKAANFLSEAAANLVESGNSFLATLTELKAIEFSQVGDLPQFNSVVWLGTTPSTLARPDRPTVDTNVSDLLDQLRALIAPTAPVDTFNYSEPGYSSPLRSPLIEKLLYDLVNGGYGIDTTDEVALFNRERDREELITQANIEELRRQASATGFPMPQGSLYLALQRARQEQMSKLSSVNRDIALKRADLYVDNRRQVIQQVLASEDQSIGLYNAIQNRTLAVAQIEVQLAISLFDAGIRLFDTRIKGLTDQINAQLEAARAQVGIYASDVQAYAAYVNAVVAGAQIDIANSRNILTRDIAAHQARSDIVKFRLQQLSTTVENAKEINKYGTEFFRTALGSAMNGINGLAVQTGEV
jgi:hypothetical protein